MSGTTHTSGRCNWTRGGYVAIIEAETFGIIQVIVVEVMGQILLVYVPVFKASIVPELFIEGSGLLVGYKAGEEVARHRGRGYGCGRRSRKSVSRP
jgi:hypothetical protein